MGTGHDFVCPRLPTIFWSEVTSLWAYIWAHLKYLAGIDKLVAMYLAWLIGWPGSWT